MSNYQPRHAKTAYPRQLPPALRGLADLITIIDDESGETP